MKSAHLFFGLVLLAAIGSSCAQIYYSPEAKTRAMSHRVIAIVPPTVSIAAKKKMDAEAIREQQRTESMNFQREMYSWMLRRKMQNKIFLDVIDVETTNAKLTKAGYFDGEVLTPAEMCEILGVDAIITSNYALTKPMSDGAALALGALVGVWGATNTKNVTMDIHDAMTARSIWNYSHQVSGSVGSTPAQLVDNLMRAASRRMPYTN